MLTLVSFPRSGRNWLCLLLDVYNGAPVFNNRINNPNNPDQGSNFLGTYNHDHKSNKKINGRILYLYRNPIDVIYSMLNANTIWVKEDKKLKTEEDRIINWTKRWKNHMYKWYFNTPLHCLDKLIINYSQLIGSPINTLTEICKFIGLPIYPFRFQAALNAVTKSFVKEVCLESNAIKEYTKKDKEQFIGSYSGLIWSVISDKKIEGLFI